MLQWQRTKTRTVRILPSSDALTGSPLSCSQVTRQLDDGVRMLQMQVHNRDGAIQLCHSDCVCTALFALAIVTLTTSQLLFNGGLLVNYLKTGQRAWRPLFFVTQTHP
jgi:hypothetical protein